VNDDLRMHSADEEVILVFVSNIPGVSDAEQIELAVVGFDGILVSEGRRLDRLSGGRRGACSTRRRE
jgi:hypothetical protein